MNWVSLEDLILFYFSPEGEHNHRKASPKTILLQSALGDSPSRSFALRPGEISSEVATGAWGCFSEKLLRGGAGCQGWRDGVPLGSTDGLDKWLSCQSVAFLRVLGSK